MQSPSNREAVAEWLNMRALRLMQQAQEARDDGRPRHAETLQTEAAALVSAAVDLRRMDDAGPDEGHGMALDVSGNYVARLQARMVKEGISAADLSRESGIHVSQLSRYFNSKTGMQPSLRNVTKLDEAMETLVKRGRRKGAAPKK